MAGSPGTFQAGKTLRFDDEITVFPNPARSGSAVVQLGALGGMPGTVQLFDQQGRILWQASLETLGAIHRLDLSDVAAGMYFLQVQPEGETRQTVKVVVDQHR